MVLRQENELDSFVDQSLAGKLLRGGVGDGHELLAHRWLCRHFGPEVTEPVRLHVDAKRYLCAAEPEYRASLSAASLRSMELQGGVLSAAEARQFEQNPFYERGAQLRRWDDRAKVVGHITPSLDYFLSYVAVAQRGATAEATS